jgi:hypothetical protein
VQPQRNDFAGEDVGEKAALDRDLIGWALGVNGARPGRDRFCWRQLDRGILVAKVKQLGFLLFSKFQAAWKVIISAGAPRIMAISSWIRRWRS